MFIWLSQLSRTLCQPEWNLSLLLLHSHQLFDDRRMRKKNVKINKQIDSEIMKPEAEMRAAVRQSWNFFSENEPIWNVAVRLTNVINNDDVCLACRDAFFLLTMFYNQLR